jgi:hypothetical protein
MNERAEELNAILQQIELSRRTWHESTQKFIVAEVNAFIKPLLLDWVVDVNDSIYNHETITLRFKNRPSGLSYNEESIFNQQEGKSGNIVKYGATLNFSYVYLGDVMVWMTYPFIPEILENTENFIDLMRLKQEKVDKQVIHEAITRFLTEVIGWHLGKVGQEQRIGFKTSQDS